jgi:hypothetical protein
MDAWSGERYECQRRERDRERQRETERETERQRETERKKERNSMPHPEGKNTNTYISVGAAAGAATRDRRVTDRRHGARLAGSVLKGVRAHVVGTDCCRERDDERAGLDDVLDRLLHKCVREDELHERRGVGCL